MVVLGCADLAVRLGTMHWYIKAPLGYAGSAISDSTEPSFPGIASWVVSTRPGPSACVTETGHLLGTCVSCLYAQNAWYRPGDASRLLLGSRFLIRGWRRLVAWPLEGRPLWCAFPIDHVREYAGCGYFGCWAVPVALRLSFMALPGDQRTAASPWPDDSLSARKR